MGVSRRSVRVLPLWVKPNAGVPRIVGDAVVYEADPETPSPATSPATSSAAPDRRRVLRLDAGTRCRDRARARAGHSDKRGEFMKVSVVAVAGAGFMGSGIAESMITAGRRVFLYEPDQEPLDRARKHITASLAKAAARGKLGQETPDELLEHVTFTTRIEDLVGADAVIEAVIEDVGVKRDLFSRLDAALPDAQFLASNTSSIPIAELAAATNHPERVLGLHFFSPVPVMKLVEIVLALDTSDEVTGGRGGARRRDRQGAGPHEGSVWLHREHAARPVPDGRGADVRRRIRLP